jgi:hypothetical protein
MFGAVLMIDSRPAAGWSWGPSRPAAFDVPARDRYADARVGDWVTYRCTTATWETAKHTVTEKTADVISIRQERNSPQPHAIDVTIGLNDPPAVVVDPPEEEVLGSGRETLTINGTKYECQWIKVRITTPGRASLTRPAAPTVLTVKGWESKQVPAGGSVRWEAEMDGKTVTWELTGCGRGK